MTLDILPGTFFLCRYQWINISPNTDQFYFDKLFASDWAGDLFLDAEAILNDASREISSYMGSMEFDEEVEYTIVGTTEADITQNKISNESPIGSALLGAKKNQVVEVQVPAGVSKYKILSITKA